MANNDSLWARRRAARRLAVVAAAGLLAAACSSAEVDAPRGDAASLSTPPVATDDVPPAADPGDAGFEQDGEPTTDEDSDASADGSGETPRSGSDGDSDVSSDEPNGTSGSAAGSGDDESDRTTATAALHRFGDCGDVLEHVQASVAAFVGPWGLEGDPGVGAVFAEEALEADDSATDDGGSLQAGVDYSTGNIQEVGIDEPDVLKTDGKRIVVAAQNSVHVVDVTGPEPVLVGSLFPSERWGSKLLLHGDRLLVFASRWGVVVPFGEPRIDTDEADVVEPEPGWGPTTQIMEVDLSAQTPQVVQTLDIEGNYISARMVDGVVRVVTSSSPRGIAWAVPQAAGVIAEQRATEANVDLVARTTVDHWLPRYQLRDAGGTVIDSGQLVDCDRTWAPAHYAGPGTLSVTTIDIAGDGLAGSIDTTSILADGSTVYASPQRLYVSTTRWVDWHSTQERLDGETEADYEIRLNRTIANSEIHMFDISDPHSADYEASASVPGTVLDQYSMSEHEGHLRIATTTVPPWRFESGPDSESLVTVFTADDGDLVEVGQVGGLGVGERIYAVRYLGDIAAVVTFRQVDPLYVLDLSDPSAPTVRGELKIHGFSAYLHPVGDDLLLGVGQDADAEGRTLGTQVSLFDVSDLSDPRRIDQWTAPGGHSQVEFNALAFLYWQPEQLAVLPITQYPQDETDAEPPFIGAVALGTDGASITERARITYAEPAKKRCRESREIIIEPDGTEEVGPFERYCWFDYEWEAQIMASAVVGDRLYTVSHKGLGAVDLASLESGSFLAWGG